ncbi:hypothetical protein HHK36_016393 [Tetracentron sinense]|uniref:Factor of DNA methylation 1-5/IDN2 domain-containing protein n=1 Tax=Tetracentron sinense TaxID=13715 RepID=A0A834Z579_TETSI|nr:hypothetical protein HHK36_016393 [Tetracentron sinense]
MKYNDISASFTRMEEDEDERSKAFMEGLKKMQSIAGDSSLKIPLQKEESKWVFKYIKNKGPEQRAKESENRVELGKLTVENNKRVKEGLRGRILELEKQLEGKQALELEMKQVFLKETIEVMKRTRVDEDMEVQKKMEEMSKEMEEKVGKMEDLNQSLTVKELKSNDELWEARKKVIDILNEMASGENGVKKMGDLDNKPFLDARKRKYSGKEGMGKGIELWALWEEHFRDPQWHPFKMITANGEKQEIIDDEDEKLKALKSELGVEVYKVVTTALIEKNEELKALKSELGVEVYKVMTTALIKIDEKLKALKSKLVVEVHKVVTTALLKIDEKLKALKSKLGVEVYKAVTRFLIEINDYNPSERNFGSEKWNFKEGRKATLKERVE